MVKDIVWDRTSAHSKLSKAKVAGLSKRWWRWNIRNPYVYTRRLSRESENWYGEFLRPAHLQAAIREESYQPISIKDVKAIMKKAGVENHYK